jgi:hypothetical protein
MLRDSVTFVTLSLSACQVLEYLLRPLYDPAIPLETFMTRRQAVAFRAGLKDATERAWAGAHNCTIACERQSPAAQGFCRSESDPTNRSLAYVCEQPGNVSTEPFVLSKASLASGLVRTPLSEASNPPLLALNFLRLGFNAFLGLPAHEQFATYMRQNGKKLGHLHASER